MQQTARVSSLPNILIVESAGNLLANNSRRRTGTDAGHRLPERTQRQGVRNHHELATSLRSKGYHTAQAACYVLDADDELPASTCEYDCAHNVLFFVQGKPGGSPADVNCEAYDSHAKRVRELNEDVVAQALNHVAVSAARGQPFFVVCGVETSVGSQEYNHLVYRLRARLQELGVEQNTMFIHSPSATVRPVFAGA